MIATAFILASLAAGAAPTTQPAPTSQPTTRADDDRHLREALAQKGGENPVQAAGRRMQAVRERLGKADSALGTQEIQNQIVRDLDQAIAMAKNAKSTSSQQRQRRRRQQARPQPKRQQQQARGAERQQQQGAKGMPDSKQTRGRAVEPKVGRRAASRANQWGFLPEALREEVLQSFKEEFLPAFRELLEQYYSTLSEKGRSSR